MKTYKTFFIDPSRDYVESVMITQEGMDYLAKEIDVHAIPALGGTLYVNKRSNPCVTGLLDQPGTFFNLSTSKVTGWYQGRSVLVGDLDDETVSDAIVFAHAS